MNDFWLAIVIAVPLILLIELIGYLILRPRRGYIEVGTT